MRRSAVLSVCLAAAALLLARPLSAQLSTSVGIGARYANPGGSFGDALDNGYGGYLKVEAHAVVIGVAGQVNVTRFGGKNGADATTVLGAQAGPRLGLGLLRVGFDLGYYTKVKKAGYSPNVSINIGPLEGGAGWTFFSGGNWLYLRAGLAI